MTRLWPFIGIALAVALGVALAPYLWWAIPVAVAVALAATRRGRLVLRGIGGALVIVAMIAWPVWLLSRGQIADAVFVVGLYVVCALWGPITLRLKRIQ